MIRISVLALARSLLTPYGVLAALMLALRLGPPAAPATIQAASLPLVPVAAPPPSIRGALDPLLGTALTYMPDTAATRQGGIWYADFGLSERVYGVSAVQNTTDPHIRQFFAAIAGLRPGPDTGVSDLAAAHWRRLYGYDLFDVKSEIYTSSLDGTNHPLAVDVGTLDTASIGHLLTTLAYSATMVGSDHLYVHGPVPPQGLAMPGAIMNAVALGPHRIVAGMYPQDVITASLRLVARQGTLGGDRGYAELATALGSVNGARLAANVPPSPFPVPRAGHQGNPLHPFGLYAVALQELTPGHRSLEIGLAYSRASDALADAPTLLARWEREGLPSYGETWRQVSYGASVSVRGRVLVLLVHLRANAPPTLWQDIVTEGDLTLLSR